VNYKGQISVRLLKKNPYSQEYEKDEDLPFGLESCIEKHYQTNLPVFSMDGKRVLIGYYAK
jgi:hypothetical protein